MEYSITPSPDGRYITLKYVGELALKTSLESHALGRELDIHRYLVDATEARNTDSVGSTYDLGYRDVWSQPALDTKAVVAMLVSPGDTSHHFAYLVSRNAGLNVKPFADRAEAVEYLRR